MLKSVSGLAGGLPRSASGSVSVRVLGYDPDAKVSHCVVELYEVVRPPLQAYLRSLGVSEDHAEDVVQETFMRLVQHVILRGSDENLRGWLFRVARNLSVDLYRYEKRCMSEIVAETVFQTRIDPAPNPEEKILLDERSKLFKAACAQLTPKQRDCVLLRAEGLRYREIAVALGVSVQRVGELMQRAAGLLGWQ